MPAIRRILKFTPAAMLGMLIVAWFLTFFWQFGFNSRKSGSHDTHYNFLCRSIFIHRMNANVLKPGWFCYPAPTEPMNIVSAPQLFYRQYELDRGWQLRLPIILVGSGILPFAIGPFLSFRFRVWHYLAYTALVAVELAYYLRWQA